MPISLHVTTRHSLVQLLFFPLTDGLMLSHDPLEPSMTVQVYRYAHDAHEKDEQVPNPTKQRGNAVLRDPHEQIEAEEAEAVDDEDKPEDYPS